MYYIITAVVTIIVTLLAAKIGVNLWLYKNWPRP